MIIDAADLNPVQFDQLTENILAWLKSRPEMGNGKDAQRQLLRFMESLLNDYS